MRWLAVLAVVVHTGHDGAGGIDPLTIALAVGSALLVAAGLYLALVADAKRREEGPGGRSDPDDDRPLG